MTSVLVAPDSPGAVLSLVRSGRAQSRSDIARVTNVSPSTAAARVQALLDAGLLHEVGSGTSAGGRRPRRLEVRPGAGTVGAVDLGSHHMVLALFDLGGVLVGQRHLPIDISDGPAAVAGWLLDQLRQMVGQLPGAPPLAGLSVGVPGPVAARTGRVVAPSRMPGWNGADLPGLLAELTDVPVLVENDANLMAVGEYSAGRHRGEDLVFVKIGSGIGCGVIAGGRLHRGSVGAAGDISHVTVNADSRIACSCGRIGCLDAIASGTALVRTMAEAGLKVTGTADVVRAAQNPEPVSARILRDAGRATGAVLATIVNFFNPDTLVLGGQLSQAEPYVASIRATLYERCLPMAVQDLPIALSTTGVLAGVTGGSHLMLEHLLAPARVNALVGP